MTKNKNIINLDELKNELTAELAKFNIHILREQGSKLGVKSPTRHSKSKLVQLIVEKKLQYHNPMELSPHYRQPFSLENYREKLMDLAKKADDIEADIVSGTIEPTEEGDAYLRLYSNRISSKDVFVPRELMIDSDMRYGDRVIGKTIAVEGGPFRGLINVISVNGHRRKAPPRKKFSELAVKACTQKINLARSLNKLLRLMDIFSPLARGQKNMIFSKGLMNATDMLLGICEAIRSEGIRLVILLLSERAEIVAQYQKRFGDCVVAAPIEASDKENARVAKLCLEQLKRDAESGKNVALVVGGMAALALPEINGEKTTFGYRTLFGSGRQLENGGSLTIVGYCFMGGVSGAKIYETLAPLSNSVTMLKPSTFMSDSPIFEVYESFTDFDGYTDAEREKIASIKDCIKQSNKTLTCEEILEFFTKK